MTLIQTNISKSEEARSSYKNSNYRNIFSSLAFSIQPRRIVEYGILDGYSLQAMIDGLAGNYCQIQAFDLFDDFPYNAADFQEINKKFGHIKDIKIEKKDFYAPHMGVGESIDILHIDIANDGDVYEFAINNYMNFISRKGIIILEGGSEERDNYDWMIKYNRRPIQPYLKSISDKYRIMVLEDFPSMTIISKQW